MFRPDVTVIVDRELKSNGLPWPCRRIRTMCIYSLVDCTVREKQKEKKKKTCKSPFAGRLPKGQKRGCDQYINQTHYRLAVLMWTAAGE